MTYTATIGCWGCQQRVTLAFHRVYTPDKAHWEGICPSCGTKNYIYRPSWDLLPIFRKYTREHLSQVTGYSLGYLSRVAAGKSPLKQQFIDRCCTGLGEGEEVLFGQPESTPQGGHEKAVT
ncbi:hypothetical protein ES703_64984 [subsurface metagenome]